MTSVKHQNVDQPLVCDEWRLNQKVRPAADNDRIKNNTKEIRFHRLVFVACFVNIGPAVWAFLHGSCQLCCAAVSAVRVPHVLFFLLLLLSVIVAGCRFPRCEQFVRTSCGLCSWMSFVSFHLFAVWHSPQSTCCTCNWPWFCGVDEKKLTCCRGRSSSPNSSTSQVGKIWTLPREWATLVGRGNEFQKEHRQTMNNLEPVASATTDVPPQENTLCRGLAEVRWPVNYVFRSVRILREQDCAETWTWNGVRLMFEHWTTWCRK